MGKITRLTTARKVARRELIGNYIPCPICKKLDGLSTWEAERYMVCQHCGAKYQKKQKYIRNRDKDIINAKV